MAEVVDVNTIGLPAPCREARCAIELVANTQHGGVNIQHNHTSAHLDDAQLAEGNGLGGVAAATVWLQEQHEAENPTGPSQGGAEPDADREVEGAPA